MKKIIFTKNSESDLKQIFQFNSASNNSFAKRIHKQIFKEIRVLANFPESAPIEPLLKHKANTFRSLIVADGRYKVIYVVKEEQIIVHTVFDCRRNPDEIKTNSNT